MYASLTYQDGLDCPIIHPSLKTSDALIQSIGKQSQPHVFNSSSFVIYRHWPSLSYAQYVPLLLSLSHLLPRCYLRRTHVEREQQVSSVHFLPMQPIRSGLQLR